MVQQISRVLIRNNLYVTFQYEKKLQGNGKGHVCVRRIIQYMQKNLLVRSIVYIVLGILIIENPIFILKGLKYVLAIYSILIGVTYFLSAEKGRQNKQPYRFSFFIGVVYLVIAAVMLMLSETIMSFLPAVLGILILLSGLIQVKDGLDLMHIQKKWGIGFIVYSSILILLGTVLIINPFASVRVVFRLFGLILIGMGGAGVVNTYALSKATVIMDIPPNKSE